MNLYATNFFIFSFIIDIIDEKVPILGDDIVI